MDTKGDLLIIDDEIEVLNTLKRFFSKEYELHIVQNIKEAFYVLGKLNIGVILCDQRMPEMKGTEFFKVVKNLYPDTIRILIAGYLELSDVIMSINEGDIFRYITKPWNLFDLKNAVREAFEKNVLIKSNSIKVEELRSTNIILENKVRERTQQLEEKNDKLQKLLASQEEFIANISHELKTPLNVICATVQLFSMYCNNGSLDERKDSIIKYIDSIKKNTYRLSKLINNIVDSSKIKSGFFKLSLSNNNIIEVVEDIVTSVTDFTESKGLNIIFDTNVEEKIIACDPEKIERIVLNLISNAIKFSNFDNEIFVEVKDKGEFVEISVEDNGIGIEKKNLKMIFDRFKQVGEALSRNGEGTGIGLSLVKSIVELQGGSIEVESEFGKGSKFIVTLPARRVSQENMLLSSKMRNGKESIQVELSDIY